MTIALFIIMCVCLLAGTAGLIYSNGETNKILMSIVAISFGCFIGYGLDTQCENYETYFYCGDENEN